MRRALSLLILPLTISGCAQIESYVNAAAVNVEQATDGGVPRPGLEPLYQPQHTATEQNDFSQPVPPAADALPFPQRLIGEDEAERMLAGDPAALRFLALRRLAETGLVPAADADRRAETNLGALLPLTHAEAPAAEALSPAPAPSAIEKSLQTLWRQPGSQSQRDFVVDNLLPMAPQQRVPLTIPDKQSARQVLARLDRLHAAGLISRGQKAAEAAAVQALLDGNTLPETLVVAPPPEPVVPAKPKKPARKTAGSSGQRMSGGVSGELKVIPSPAEINAPIVPTGFAGQVGIHLLSMGSASHAEQAWKALSTEHPELAALTYKVVRADLGDLGVTHRLIAGPLTAAKAEELCTALRPKGQMCQPTPFPP